MLMCRDLARISSDYLDGELGMARNLSVRMHLMMCRHCRSLVSNLRSSIVLIQAHSSMQMDAAFASRLDAHISKALAESSNPDA